MGTKKYGWAIRGAVLASLIAPSVAIGAPSPTNTTEIALFVNERGDEIVATSTPLSRAQIREIRAVQPSPNMAGRPAGGGNTFPSNSPEPTNWRGCGLFASEHQFVDSYTRLRVVKRIPAGSVATLSCGGAKYGYRHIRSEHQDDWTNM